APPEAMLAPAPPAAMLAPAPPAAPWPPAAPASGDRRASGPVMKLRDQHHRLAHVRARHPADRPVERHLDVRLDIGHRVVIVDTDPSNMEAGRREQSSQDRQGEVAQVNLRSRPQALVPDARRGMAPECAEDRTLDAVREK